MSEIKIVNGVSIQSKTDKEYVRVASEMNKQQALSVFFNTQEKQRAALNFIERDREEYKDNDLYKEEEAAIKANPTMPFNVQSAPDEYIEKKLNLFYFDDNENDKTITEDKDYETVLASVNTAEECQNLINILLEYIDKSDCYTTGLLMEKYGCKKFDTTQEVRKLVLALEIKKAQLKTEAGVNIVPTQAVYDEAQKDIAEEINSELNDNLIKVLFDSPEKCQAAIDAIVLGNDDITKYVDILKKLEKHKQENFPNASFTIEQRKAMLEHRTYILKELNVLLIDESTSSNKNIWTVNYNAYRRVLNNIDSAAECQTIIDKLLDTGRYGHFDAPNEIKGLLLALEMKKKEFDEKEVKKVEDPKIREERQAARELNNYVWQILFDQSLHLSQSCNQARKEIGSFEYSGLYWHSVFTGKATLGDLIKGENDPYEHLNDIYFKFSDAVSELGSYKDTTSIDEFGAKINALLANGNYDVELVKKIIKIQKSYQEAKVLEQINAVKSLPYSPENIEKMEKALEGRDSIISQLGPKIDYANAPDSQKYEYLQKLLEANSQNLSKNLGGKTPSQIIKEFDDTHIAFLKMLGVTNVQEELEAFRERTQMAGGITKGLVVISASILTGGIAGAGAVTTGIVTGTTSFGAEVYDRATDDVENLSSVGDWAGIAGHSIIDGVMVGGSMKATAAILKTGSKPMLKIGTTFVTDGTIGTVGAYGHALIDGRELTKEDAALNFGFAAAGSVLGARAVFKGAQKTTAINSRRANIDELLDDAATNNQTRLYSKPAKQPVSKPKISTQNAEEARISAMVARDSAPNNTFNPMYSNLPKEIRPARARVGQKGEITADTPICINGQIYKFDIPDNSTHIIRGEDLSILGTSEIKLTKTNGKIELEILKGEVGVITSSADDIATLTTIHSVTLKPNTSIKLTTNCTKTPTIDVITDIPISPRLRTMENKVNVAGQNKQVSVQTLEKPIETGKPLMITEDIKISIDNGAFVDELNLTAFADGESVFIGNAPRATIKLPDVELGTLIKVTRMGDKFKVEKFYGNVKLINEVPTPNATAPSTPKPNTPVKRVKTANSSDTPATPNKVSTTPTTVKQEVIFPEWGNIHVAGQDYDLGILAESLKNGESIILGNTSNSAVKIATDIEAPVAIKITKYGAGYKVENLRGAGFKYDKHNIAQSVINSEIQVGSRIFLPDGRELVVTEALLKKIKEGKFAKITLNSNGKPVINSSKNYNDMSITIENQGGKYICVDEAWEGAIILK